MFSPISPRPLICEMGCLEHLNERKKLLHICQHVQLVNYPFKASNILVQNYSDVQNVAISVKISPGSHVWFRDPQECATWIFIVLVQGS